MPPLATGTQNTAATLESWQFLERVNRVTTWPTIPLVGECPKELRTHVHTETPLWRFTAALLVRPRRGNNSGVHQLWTEKQNVVCPYNGWVFSYKKKWNPDACDSMDGPWKHCGKRGSQTQQGTYTPRDSTSTVQNRQHRRDRKRIRCCQELGVESNCWWVPIQASF